MTQEFTITAVAPNGEDREKTIEGTRADAQDKVAELEGLGFTDVGIQSGVGQEAAHVAEDGAVVQQGGKADGGVEVVEESNTPTPQNDTENALSELGDSIHNDPLDVLPGYMITTVEGKPTLNKRGVSVLAYHYGVSVTEHEILDRPSETAYESAAVRIEVEIDDGRTFTGSGEAHADEVAKEKLLRMAETRAYKRAVIFATGTGIVGYQEMVSELE